MAKEKNNHVVIAAYSNEEAAKQATKALQTWDKANADIKLGAIGMITKQGDKVKTNVGRKSGSGAKVGAVLGVTAAVLSGGITLIPGVIGGAVGGGVVGSFFKKSVNLTKEDIQQLGQKLDAGQVAVVVAVDENEVEATRNQLIAYGGQVQTFAVPAEALDEVAQAQESGGTPPSGPSSGAPTE